MIPTWRWFGPKDPVLVDHMVQAGVEAVVTALHHIPNGAIWDIAEIQKRQHEISKTSQGYESGLTWQVVESLPVSEEIKRQSGEWRTHVENYRQSMRNLATCGVTNICYNFMPVLDWTRTDLAYTLPNGARCMRFDIIDFAIFDIHLLGRPNAENNFPAAICAGAAQRFRNMTENQKKSLTSNVLSGLPGAEESYSLSDLREVLALYDGISDDVLHQHQVYFLQQILPVAEDLGITMNCHPDDPPFSLLGLPRIMSCEADYRRLFRAVDSPAIGITLCSGSLGVRADNDLLGMMERLGERVHFLHLRNVTRESDDEKTSFHEASHLDGETDMVALVKLILNEEARRRAEGRPDYSIPFRPDHGQEILSDLISETQPGYPAVGRLKGLAELRGIEMALSRST